MRRFLLFVCAVLCAAGLLCGVMTAKANTEKRLYGTETETIILAFSLIGA